MIRVGSLFSGIGGIDLGLEQAGFTIKWQCENDEYCSKVLKKHWPNVPNLGDIYQVDWDTVGGVDLICGGFPCQPVSIVGKRGGTDDDRWLWPEFFRCIRTMEPAVVLVENVPGLLTVQQGRAAQEVFGDLASLGYDAEWDCIPAATFGARHFRDRLFIVAYSPEVFQVGGVDNVSQNTQTTYANERQIFTGRDLRGTDKYGQTRWSFEPDLGRVVDGFPPEVDRLGSLGNAVVPQVAAWLGKRIKEACFAKHDTDIM